MIEYVPIPREKNITTTNYNCERHYSSVVKNVSLLCIVILVCQSLNCPIKWDVA